MRYIWKDYNPEYLELINSFLDNEAISMTGLDEGFDNYVSALIADSTNYPGAKDYIKVIFEGEIPIAVLVFGIYDGILTVAEIIVAPEYRGKGKGTEIIRGLLQLINKSITETVNQINAVIFPNNIASQKVFEKAGFRFDHAHEDGDAWYYVYK